MTTQKVNAINNSEKIDSIIFDLDGTLWDASKTCTRAWNKALGEVREGSTELNESTIRSLSGLKIEVILKEHFGYIPEHDRDKLFKLYQTYEKELMKASGGNLFPNVKQVLNMLSEKYRLFIVSNCLTGYIENFIEFHKLQNLFVDFESSGNTGLPKSENIKLVVARNDLKKPIYVGDTIWDYEAAQTANVPFVYAMYGFGKVNNAYLAIKDIAELDQYIASISMPMEITKIGSQI
ncbi:HAD family hydrolase [Flavihumibacter sp. R14]|nr:HAD family hydrolase [Flavihumibacter soli]